MWSEGAEKVVGLIGTSSSSPDAPELVVLLGDGHISGGRFVSLNLSRCLWIGGLDERVVNLPVEVRKWVDRLPLRLVVVFEALYGNGTESYRDVGTEAIGGREIGWARSTHTTQGRVNTESERGR
jgi:hypothetical protein